MNFAYYIPVAAIFSGISVLAHLLSLPKRASWQNSLIWLYSVLLASNLCIALMISRSSSNEAEFYLFLLRHFFFSLPVLFLWFSLTLVGGSIRWLIPSFVLTVILILLADLDYLLQLHWLLDRMERHSWGYFPRGRPLAIVLLALLAFYSIFVAFRFMLGRTSGLARQGMLPVILLFAVWWMGIVLSMLPFSGISVFPPGPAVDATISAVIAALLTRGQGNGLTGHLRMFSGAFASVSMGTLVGWLLMTVLPGVDALLLLIAVSFTSLGSLAGWIALSRLRLAYRPVFVVLQSDFELSYQEARICELILEGLGRVEIESKLGVGAGTLRNHLTSIYGKTIDIYEPGAEKSRDKLQRLTIFLSRIQSPSDPGNGPLPSFRGLE